MSILVTGGAGYIGSHTVLELLEKGHEVVVFDNLSNSCEESLNRVQKLTGKSLKFYEADMLDRAAMDKIFDENPDITAVIHFAGLKAVGESVLKPIEYYYNNICGTIVLIEAMKAHNCKNIIFSSSATVYGIPETPQITELFPKGQCSNPYGWTKSMIEQILIDLQTSDPEWNVVLLRYFNPIGAHKSGEIGEDPQGIPNNLVPYIAQVAVGRREHLNVYGNDYNTPDGTGVRDYLHVVDLAKGHIAALRYLEAHTGVLTVNLGTGKGTSVLDIIKAFEEHCGVKIPYKVTPRRAGDIAEVYASTKKAEELLGWRAEKTIVEMCVDSYNYAKTH